MVRGAETLVETLVLVKVIAFMQYISHAHTALMGLEDTLGKVEHDINF